MPISETGTPNSDSPGRRFMQTSRHQFHTARKGAGFTLIELLVVLVIIGVMASVIAISISPNQSSPQRESRRFHQVLEAAREQAVLFNQELGVELRGNSYRVFQWQVQQWRVVDNDLFAEYQLPRNLSQTLWLNGLPQRESASGSDRPSPQILFFSTGEVTPFAWTLADPADDNQWRLTASLLGEFDLKPEPLQ